jgi:uncharacterized protein (DUF983 family)
MTALASLFHAPSESAMTAPTTSLQSVLRGLRGRCPNCGRGHVFGNFLKVNDNCSACGEELFHQRADDFPAYLVIFLVGHILVPLALVVETEYAPAMWLQFAVWVPLTIALSLALIQPVKGAVVALQWSAGMHGFAESRAVRKHQTNS